MGLFSKPQQQYVPPTPPPPPPANAPTFADAKTSGSNPSAGMSSFLGAGTNPTGGMLADTATTRKTLLGQ